MLSRVAESLYWMSRYVERAENVARFVSVNQDVSLGGLGGVDAQWRPLIQASGDETLFNKHYGEASQRNILDFLIFDERNLNSIRSCLFAARENGRMVRETLSTSVWEALNRFFLRVQTAVRNRESVLHRPHEFLDDVKDSSHLMLGASHATISQGEAWNFMRMGRLLERADKTSRILDVKYFILLPDPEKVGSSLDAVQWASLLNSTSALTMYRKRHGVISPELVAEFLLLDRAFPRSAHYCVTGTERAMHDITGVATDYFSNPAEQYVGKLRYELTFLTIQDVIQQGMHEFIDSVQVRLNQIGEKIHDTFFARPSQQQTQSQSQ